MNQRITRSIQKPKREGLSWTELWQDEDKGLILCWELGRKIREKEPELAQRAENGELPPLGWKGGVEKRIKAGEKIGTLFYLAQWQGLRGENLDINLDDEPTLICSRTGVKVTFTGDFKKYANA